jgi:putative aminopeptidase FrvX
MRFGEVRAPARNVVAILPGSGQALKGEYVAIGAHNDHIGFNHEPVDHDSLRAFNMIVRPGGEDDPARPASAEEMRRIRAILDSLRRIHAPRRDSIYNGADDDGSGSVALLEIAESLANAPTKPKRSILFIWHAGEEEGLWGSEYFTDHPTVPRDSIVTELNMDMIGRGHADDVKGGGPGYLQLIGSRRLSTELGDLVETVAKTEATPFKFDYQFDANGHPQQYYCRSDHYEYARYGIPIVFFSTGGHRDYHQVTDEAQYIDYEQLARVATLVRDVAVRAANLDHRLIVDKKKPDPHGQCVQ